MPWNQHNGGRGGFSGGKGGGRGPVGPEMEEVIQWFQNRLRQLHPRGQVNFPLILGILFLLIVIWMLSGFYRVLPAEQGVVMRFGAFERTTSPGLNYHLPYPIEEVIVLNVTQLNRIIIGGVDGSSPRGAASRESREEILMLTGDENIVDIDFTVFWVIKDAANYLFRVSNQALTVRAVSESAMREVIGTMNIGSILTEGRQEIETRAKALIQATLDSYEAGVMVTQVQLQGANPPQLVIDAFRDVQAARADQEANKNTADAYANRVVPESRGDAARVVQNAEAYRIQTVAEANGDADRFLLVLKEYRKAPEVTRRRLYIEVMESIFESSDKIILDGSGVLPVLPLNPGGLPGALSGAGLAAPGK